MRPGKRSMSPPAEARMHVGRERNEERGEGKSTTTIFRKNKKNNAAEPPQSSKVQAIPGPIWGKRITTKRESHLGHKARWGQKSDAQKRKPVNRNTRLWWGGWGGGGGGGVGGGGDRD